MNRFHCLQKDIPSRSFCSREASVKLMIDLEHLMSSAKRSNEELDTQSSRSLMYTRNRRGPRMLPCGTPERTGRNAE